MASVLYLKGIEQAFLGNIDLESDTIKLKYMATSYTPDVTTENFLSDVSASEASGAPTETLTNVDVRIDTGNTRVEIDADDVTEASVSTTTNAAVIYKDTGVAATSPLIAYIDLGATITTSNQTLSISFSTEGIFAINST